MPEISFNPQPVFYVIVGVLAGMIIGWIMGFFDSNNRASKKIHSAELKSEAAIKQAQEKTALAEKLINASGAQDDPGLLRLKKENGRYKLEIDGVLAGDKLPQDKKKRLIELVSVFRPYLEGEQTPGVLSQPAAPLQAAPAPATIQQAGFQPNQPDTKKPEPEKNFSTLSIVGQIDTVLQKRLMTSSLAKTGIRLQESPQGGVEVYVGVEKYHTIDDVPDEAIKTAIREAIAEWEEKFTPGA
ncbi:MAG: hypothetical protein HY864_06070 [Chloroflexi bacterium]|nr:hypothetical protein [Chloroflexota bacterium]